MDAWWQAHPDWEPHGATITHDCFRPIVDPLRAQFRREVYQNQHQSFDQALAPNIVGAVYAAVINMLTGGFWQALQQGYPFVVNKHWHGFKWLYAVNATDVKSWASCPTQDLNCYFLPISNCTPPYGQPDTANQKQLTVHDWQSTPEKREQYAWLEAYLTRPNRLARKHLAEVMAQQDIRLPSIGRCTWIHVRRADAMKKRTHKHNFHALGKYLKAGQVAKGETILLLAEDEVAMEEAKWLHPEYKWKAWKRARHRGEAKLHAHIPSQDPALELLTVLVEIELAGQCRKGINGTSNLVRLLENSMMRQQGGGEIEMIQVDVNVYTTEERIDPKEFMSNLEEEVGTAKEKHKKKAQLQKKVAHELKWHKHHAVTDKVLKMMEANLKKQQIEEAEKGEESFLKE